MKKYKNSTMLKDLDLNKIDYKAYLILGDFAEIDVGFYTNLRLMQSHCSDVLRFNYLREVSKAFILETRKDFNKKAFERW